MSVLNQFLDLGEEDLGPPPAPPPPRDSAGAGGKRPTVQLHRPDSGTGASALPPFSLGSSESSSGGEGAALRRRCEPPRAGPPGTPTHVVLRVLRVWGFPRTDAERVSSAPSGRRGLDHFLDGAPLTHTTATVAVIRTDDQAQFGPVRRRRCAAPRVPFRPTGDTVEALWGETPGEARVRLRADEAVVRAALLLGTEVLAVSHVISLRGASRRFFAPFEFYRPGFPTGPPSQVIATARLAFELWPPGSTFPMVEDSGELDPAMGAALVDAALIAARGSAPRVDWRDHDSISVTTVDTGADPFVRTCGFCDGVGRKTCVGCGGHGALVCKACDGMPPLPCARCQGTGVLQAGLEAISAGAAAAVVGGSSVGAVHGRRCTVCWGAPKACQECFGVGALRCCHCSGAGWTPCTRCVVGTRDFAV